MYTYQKYKWECSSINAVETWDWNVRKDRHLLVYICRWQDHSKKPAIWKKVAQTTRNSNFPIFK